ncbi:MAG: RHS repeat protein, partial [Lachnospiraceae bacterium]|nr:RHS repeat protein [Lachnospiraceae bacterium]
MVWGSFILHQAHRLTSVTTPLGYRTDFDYSAVSDILEESDSLGRVT